MIQTKLEKVIDMQGFIIPDTVSHTSNFTAYGLHRDVSLSRDHKPELELTHAGEKLWTSYESWPVSVKGCLTGSGPDRTDV